MLLDRVVHLVMLQPAGLDVMMVGSRQQAAPSSADSTKPLIFSSPCAKASNVQTTAGVACAADLCSNGPATKQAYVG